jgi:hypothetical protein
MPMLITLQRLGLTLLRRAPPVEISNLLLTDASGIFFVFAFCGQKNPYEPLRWGSRIYFDSIKFDKL